MKKHLTQLPAVAVIFFDLDWDDPQWGEKRLECTARVQSVRYLLYYKLKKENILF